MKEHSPRHSNRYSLRVALPLFAGLVGFCYGLFFAVPGENAVQSEASVPLVSPASSFVTEKVRPVKTGFQHKAGIVPELYWKHEHAFIRQKIFTSWMSRYIHHSFITQPLLPYPYCQIYVNHQYKFIWIKGHKVGGTAMRGPLGWLCDDHWKIPENASFEYCSHGLWNEAMSLARVKHIWKEYFVFGTVRNPYDRFASAYEYVKSGKNSGRCEVTIQDLSFKDVCQDPYVFAAACYVDSCWCSSHHFRHFMPQAPCLLTESLLPAVDYLADTSTLDEDIETIIKTINERRDKDLPELEAHRSYGKINTHGDKGKQQDSGEKPQEEKAETETKHNKVPEYVQKLYDEHPSCLNSVAWHFYQDFLLLGYDRASRSNNSRHP